MPLQIEVVSEHKSALGDDHIRVFGNSGGTIGRSVKSDWTLPDPDNFVSGRHCMIDYQAGAYYLQDISTNGVYMNGEKKPVGKGNPRRLFDGDRLRMGDIEFVVQLDEGQELELEMEHIATFVDLPDHGGERVPEEIQRSSIQLLDEEAITGDDEFQSALLGTANKRRKFTPEPGLSETQAVPLPRIEQQKVPKRRKRKSASVDANQLLEAFVKGLDIKRSDIDESTNLLELMENAGNILKEFVYGSCNLLASRSVVKNMFKMEETIVLPQYNNPLKLAEDNRDSLLQLLVGQESDHLAPGDAVQQVCRDLKFHHDALIGAFTTAFLEFTDRFDPDELESNFDSTSRGGSFFSLVNRLRYWRMYSDLYPIMTQAGNGQFPHQFGEAFVRAYGKHISEYKYLDGPSGDTMAIKSVKLLQQAFAEVEEASGEASDESQARPRRDRVSG